MKTFAASSGALRQRALTLALVILGLSCGGDGTAPNPPGGGVTIPASIGDTLNGQWSGTGDVTTYRALTSGPTTLTVYAQSLAGSFTLEARDSGDGSLLGSLTVLPNGANNLFEVRTTNFNVGSGRVVLVRVSPISANGTFRLFLAEINDAPESGSSVVVAGDTIRSSLEHPADLDRFFVHAAASLELAVFGRSLKDGISFRVLDSADIGSSVYGLADEDLIASHLGLHRTAVIVIPAGHTAEVRVERIFGGNHAGGYEMWLYEVNRAPEHVAPGIAVNDTVTGELLDNSADIDEFTVSLAAPTELIGYLGGSAGLFDGSAWLFVSDGGLPTPYPNIQDQAAATELEGAATGRFVVIPGQVKVEVRGVSTDLPAGQAGPGAYSVMLREIDRRPEHASPTLLVTDTVETEQVDYVGDIDEFSLPVLPGELYNGFLQVPGVASQAHLNLTATEAADTLGRLLNVTSGATLAEHYTGEIFTGVIGTLTFTVQAQTDHDVADRGSYRLFAYKINPNPEILPVNLAPGDSVFGETIEFPGDADNFFLAQGVEDKVNVFLVRSPVDTGTITATVEGPGSTGHGIICLAAAQGPQGGCGSGFISVINQPESLSVSGYSTYHSPYGVAMYSLNDAAEGQPGMIQIGVPVLSQLAPPGDLDRYTFQYSKGQLLDVTINEGPELTGFDINAEVDPDGAGIFGQSPLWPRTGRFELPQSGTYTVDVYGAFGGSQYGEQGSYTITLDTVPLGPELAPANVLPGDSRGENIDVLGDVDEFILTAVAGSYVQARFTSGGAPLSGYAIGDSVPLIIGRNGILGRATVPADGKLRIRVAEVRNVPGPIIFAAFSQTGPYTIVFSQIDPAPEHVSPIVTLGVLVSGEDLPVEGELDQFTFTGSASQSLTGTISNPQGFTGGVTVLEILDPTGTVVLGSATSHDSTVGSTGPVVLPANGTYIVRVRAEDDTLGTGGYQFTVQ